MVLINASKKMKIIFSVNQYSTKRIKVIFSINPDSTLWTTIESIHTRLGSDQEDIKDIPLEDFIIEAMIDVQAELDLADIDYSGWTTLTNVPNMIRKAVTYGAIEILIARKLQSFKSRVIPYAGPVRFEAIERDATKAIDYFHSKMQISLDKYIAKSQGGKIIMSSTEDEEPVFSMEDIEDTVQGAEEESWYTWLLSG
jgi:hypothetical protein